MVTVEQAGQQNQMQAEKVLLCRLLELGLPAANREAALNAIIQFASNLIDPSRFGPENIPD